MATPNPFNETKFRELVVYIALRCQDLPHSGKTKLYKMLFYADFEAYRRTGSPITGTEYLAWQHGPVPESRQRQLIESGMNGALAIQQRGQEQRLIPLRQPNCNVFSGEEMDIINRAIDTLRDDTAGAASRRSHNELGWLAAFAEHDATDRQVVIPYDTVFVSNRKLDPFEEAHARQLVARFGWPAE